MTPLLSYLLQSTIASALCYFFYQAFLRRNTFYRWNRLFFIAAIFIAAIFPALRLDSLFAEARVIPAVIQYIPDLTFSNTIAAPAFNWPLFTINFFYAGILMLLFRFFIQMFSIFLLKKKAIAQKLDGVSIINTTKNISPFSFFNEIYINPAQHTAAEMEQIIRHEMIHAKQYHSADILLSEIFAIVYWFNPFAWLLKKSLKQNLEFLTDQQVLAAGVDAKVYQYCLLKVSGIHTNMAAASYFNFSKLKNRIIMMNKKRSSQLNVLKYFLLIPVAAFLLMAFNSSVKNIRSGVVNFMANDTVPAPPPPPDNMNAAEPPPPPDVLIDMPDSVENVLHKNKAVKIIKLKDGGEAVVTLTNGKTEVYNLNNESSRKNFEKKYGKLVPPPLPPLPPVPPVPTLPPAPQHPPTVSVKEVNGLKPVYYLDGKMVASIENIHPNDIASIEVYKGENANVKYGAGSGKYGVVAVTSKSAHKTVNTNGNAKNGSNDIVAATDTKNKPDIIITQANDNIIADEGMANALYYINGKEVTREIVKALDPAKINRMDIYKSTNAVKKFGEKGKNGVVEISTK